MSYLTFLMKLAIAILIMLIIDKASAAEPRLKFHENGVLTKSVPLSVLKNTLRTYNISCFNKAMNKNKRYKAFKVKEIVDFAYQARWSSKTYSSVLFTTLDNYEAMSNLDKIKEGGGYLAFEDLDQDKGWEPVGYGNANPGPFYLVWTGKEQTKANAYPWPWQVSGLNLIKFENQYSAIIPKGAKTDSAEYRGYEIFRNRCIHCHSLNQQGGKIGPDLNAPKNITSYRSKFMIKEIIKHSSKYRHSHMPDHKDLSDKQLEELYSYLKHQENETK